jgi:hypothetical protein
LTKNIGTDYDIHAQKTKPSSAGAWVFDLLFPLILAGGAVLLGRYGWPF